MDIRVLFTEGNNVTGHQFLNKRLYSRVTLTGILPDEREELVKRVNEREDPIVGHIKDETGLYTNSTPDAIDISGLGEFKIMVNVLVMVDGDFSQYSGEINRDIIQQTGESILVTGIDMESLYIWLFGLLINGKYDGSNYRFELIKKGDVTEWSIKVLHYGLFKALLKVNLRKQEEIDLDEYFIEDLERYYVEGVEFRTMQNNWKYEKNRYLEEIKLLKDQNEISRLRDSVRLMKSRISKYFVPLVNSLLKEKGSLIEKLDGVGDTVFSSTRKRKSGDTSDQFDSENFEIGLKTEAGDGLSSIEKERNKRIKLREKETEEADNYIKAENNDGNGDNNSSILLHAQDVVMEIETQPAEIECVKDDSVTELANKSIDESFVFLEEETELDEETDVSVKDVHENNNDRQEQIQSDEVTEVSDF